MNEQTKKSYLSLAGFFLKTLLIDKGINPTEKNIRQTLLACAPDHRPDYWRRLRRALVVQQLEADFSKTAKAIEKVVNPITEVNASDAVKALKKPKQQRRKHVEKDEHLLLKRHLTHKGDNCLVAMIEIARIVGCRPIEMMTLQLHDNHQILITGAKKTEDGLRGMDRTLILSPTDYNVVAGAILTQHEYKHTQGLSEAQLQSRLQHRLATATKRLWPRRTHQITLYSYRHQMGSDLKASGRSKTEVAAIMGHQSVDSVLRYGNRRRSSRNLTIGATQDAINAVRKTEPKHPDFLSKQKRKKQLHPTQAHTP
tara:strand:- start:1967 stop:2902 length:936 start_codon:yes stop_codon:yes gene_type:complete